MSLYTNFNRSNPVETKSMDSETKSCFKTKTDTVDYGREDILTKDREDKVLVTSKPVHIGDHKEYSVETELIAMDSLTVQTKDGTMEIPKSLVAFEKDTIDYLHKLCKTIHPSLKIMVIGNIAGGKSSFLDMVLNSGQLKLNVYHEPVKDWSDVLSLFYSDYEKYCAMSQNYIFTSHMKHMAKFESPYISDSSFLVGMEVYTESLHESGTMCKGNYMILQKTFRNFLQASKDIVEDKEPNFYIYIDTDPEVCLKRIALRNREFEKGISLDYLKGLDKKFKQMVAKLKKNGSNVVTINGNKAKNDVSLEILANIEKESLKRSQEA